MSPRSTEEIVNDYFTTLQNAYASGKLNPNKLHLAEDIVVFTPNGRAEGKTLVLKAYEEMLIPNIQKLVIHKQFSDRSSVCTIYDYVTKSPHLTIPAAAWYKVKDGLIYEMHIFFDPALWEKAMSGKQRKAG
jgi:hypothetical protein